MSSPSTVEPLDTTGPSGETQAGRLPDRDLPSLVRAPAGRGGDGALPRRAVRHRSADGRRLLLRLPREPAVHARGPRRHREEDGAHRQAEPADREEAPPEGRGARALREEGPDAEVPADPGEVGRPRPVLHDGGVHRLLPRAAPAVDEGHQGLQAEARARRSRTGRARKATRRCSASTGTPSSRRRSSTSTCTASRRRSAATTASSGRELDLFSIADETGAGLDALAPEGRLHPQADRGLLARRALRGRLRHRLHARTSRSSTCGTRAGTPSTTRRTCTRRSRSRTSSTS